MRFPYIPQVPSNTRILIQRYYQLTFRGSGRLRWGPKDLLYLAFSSPCCHHGNFLRAALFYLLWLNPFHHVMPKPCPLCILLLLLNNGLSLLSFQLSSQASCFSLQLNTSILGWLAEVQQPSIELAVKLAIVRLFLQYNSSFHKDYQIFE